MDDNSKDLIKAGAILAIIYFGVVRPITNTLGLTKSAADKAEDNSRLDATQNIIDSILAKQKPTKTPGEWKLIADTIHRNLGTSAISDNKADAVYQVCRIQNDADAAWLLKQFGYRNEYYFGIPTGTKNLPSFLVSNLSDSQLNTIRWNHTNKGIKLKII